ncbi:MAG: LysR family transcriptional regulator [Dehalococcoidia bacterium]|nr:LysR family transcriptional regulator [Dehalococcoidia bacterium]
MDLRQIQLVRAVVRAGSVTRAAEQELVAQPAVSKRIRALERELGVDLFHRVGRRVVATEAGLALADCADRIDAELAATLAELTGPGANEGRRLAICATETLADHLLPPALALLRERWPRARIAVEMASTDEAVAGVLGDAVDLAFVPLPLVDSRLEVHAVASEAVLVAVPRGHAWEGRPAVPLAEVLADTAFLFSMPGHGLRTQLEQAARAAGLAMEPRFELRSQQAMLALTAAGAGITLAPRMALAGREDVAGVPLDPPLAREIGWVRRPGRILPAIAAELLALVEGAVQSR